MTPDNQPVRPFSELQVREYESFVNGLGFVELPMRTQIEFTGNDRAAFLHNLCTNHVKGLLPGADCEAFITNVQGKILGHVQIFAREESLWLDTVPGQASTLMSHFDHFHIREKVKFNDRTVDEMRIAIASAAARTAIASLRVTAFQSVNDESRPAGTTPMATRDGLEVHRTSNEPPTDQLSASLGDVPTRVSSGWMFGESTLFLSTASQDLEAVRATLVSHGFGVVSQDVAEAVRIESGWPEYGRDISSDNLPHEVNRVTRSISFVKGCYLGQETVARMDALGHANWLLCGLRFTRSELPGDANEIQREGKVVAKLMSRAWSVRYQSPLAMAYIRRELAIQGQYLSSPWGDAEVIIYPK